MPRWERCWSGLTTNWWRAAVACGIGVAVPLGAQAPAASSARPPSVGAACTVAAATSSGASPGAVAVTSAGGDVAAKGSPPVTAPSKKGSAGSYKQWTVQVATYETFDQAQSLQQSLCQRGYDARVVGVNRPYSVRVGHFASSRDALVVARRLRSSDLTVFVTPDQR
jgi:cell division protein FtsN